jgi:hypothetical protein
MERLSLEKWLEKIVEECRKESQRNLAEFEKKPVKMSMSIRAGEESFGFDIDLSNIMEKFILPAQLLQKGFDGIETTIGCLEIPLRLNHRIRGYSGSEYLVPFYLEDKEKQIIFEPMLLSGFMEAFGLGKFAYSAFSPFLALEFLKYIDIMNAQTKPTIMAFVGLTGFQNISEVNFFDFIKSQLKSHNITPKKKDIEESMKAKNIYEIAPESMFKAYGIPRFQIQLIDALRLSLYDPEKTLEKEKMKAYAASLGIPGFLNPTIVDYPLFITRMSRKSSPEVVGEIMRKGKALGHSPSRSELLASLKTSEALDDPLDLMKELAKLGLLTEIRGMYKLSSNGLRMVNAEVIGKPKEWSLSKIWNVVKKAKDILPFLKFLSRN